MKNRFEEGLARLKQKAGSRRELSVADILETFSGQELSEEEVKRIYAFLEQENLTLADYVPHDTASLNLGSDLEALYGDSGASDEEEQKLFEMYREELEGVRPLSGEEETKLLGMLRTGSESEKRQARERLAEGNLHWVVSLAREHAGRGAALSDLIQEGNLALLTALDAAAAEPEPLSFLEKSIREGMKSLLKEQASYSRSAVRMTEDANRILEALKDLEEETGGTVSPEALSRHLGISKGRVEEVLRESANAIRNARDGQG